MSNQQQQPRLSILPVNKTVAFYSPIEGEDVLVRTGTISEGSCFFHSILHAYSSEYVHLNNRGRKSLVQKLRSNLAAKLDKQRWENMSNGLVAKIPFQENINSILSDFYRYVEKKRSGKTKSGRRVIRELISNDTDSQTYEIVTQLIILDHLEKEILPKAYDESSELKMSECMDAIVKAVVDYCQIQLDALGKQLDKKRKVFCLKKLSEMIRVVVKEAERVAFNDYLENLEDETIYVDSYTIGLISDRFRRDVYFLDSRTRMPYRIGGDEHIKGRKSLILMWTGGVHYEVVGRLLQRSRVQREFTVDDPLIRRINTYLFKPEKVVEMYPRLIPYLPKDIREKIGIDMSETDSSHYESSSDESESDESTSDSQSNNSTEDSSWSGSPKRSRKRNSKDVRKSKKFVKSPKHSKRNGRREQKTHAKSESPDTVHGSPVKENRSRRKERW